MSRKIHRHTLRFTAIAAFAILSRSVTRRHVQPTWVRDFNIRVCTARATIVYTTVRFSRRNTLYQILPLWVARTFVTCATAAVVIVIFRRLQRPGMAPYTPRYSSSLCVVTTRM
jgi:hypothetical protein